MRSNSFLYSRLRGEVTPESFFDTLVTMLYLLYGSSQALENHPTWFIVIKRPFVGSLD